MSTFTNDLVKINDRTQKAFASIVQVTDKAVAEFSSDVSKMAKALLHDKIKNPDASSGDLEQSIKTEKTANLAYTVRTDAADAKGYGYGAAQEWGWRTGKRSRKVKGKKYILRATFGMIKRWARGEKWRD